MELADELYGENLEITDEPAAVGSYVGPDVAGLEVVDDLAMSPQTMASVYTAPSADTTYLEFGADAAVGYRQEPAAEFADDLDELPEVITYGAKPRQVLTAIRVAATSGGAGGASELQTRGSAAVESAAGVDASGVGGGDGGEIPVRGSAEYPDEGRERELVAAYPAVVPQITELSRVYDSGDYTGRDDFVAHGGDPDDPTHAVFKFQNPTTGRLNVVGFAPDDDEIADADAARRVALIRGTYAAEEQKGKIEQPAALSPDDDMPDVREHMEGTRLSSLTAQQKGELTREHLEAADDSLHELIWNCRCFPNSSDSNTLVDTRQNNEFRLVDYVPLDDDDKSDVNNELYEGGALLDILEGLGVPTPSEQLDVHAWLAGARVFSQGLEVLATRCPDVQRDKQTVINPREISDDDDEGILPMPSLPFFQESQFARTGSRLAGVEDVMTQDLFIEFVDGVERYYELSEVAGEPRTRQVDITARDGQRVTVWVKNDIRGNGIARGITIHQEDGAETRYEFDLQLGTRHYGKLVRIERTGPDGAPQMREIGMQELAGLMDYLDIDARDEVAERTSLGDSAQARNGDGGSGGTSGLELRRASPALRALFTFGLVLGPRAEVDREYVDSVFEKNMPPLLLQTRLHGPLVPLGDEEQARINERARELIEIPYGDKMAFTEYELQLYQGWLDGVAAGLSDSEIARNLGVPHRSFKRNLDDMRTYLGACNQASAVYSLLFYGDEHGKRLLDVQTPQMTPNRRLHFYLGALGFEVSEVVDLTRSVNPRSNSGQVAELRKSAGQLLIGNSKGGLATAIVGAFQLGHFVTLEN